MFRVDVEGRFADTGVDLTSSHALEVKPYEVKEQKVELKLGGGEYAQSSDVHTISLEIDNQVEGAGDGATIKDQLYPEYRANDFGPIVTGTLDRRFVDSDLYDDFLAGQEGAIKITLARAAVGTLVIELPRIVYTGQAIHAGGTGIVTEEGVPFQALASGTNYTTAPISMTET